MKIKFSFIVALSAAFVAGCAAYYSVFGLSQLFAGASIAVIIMASSLEFSKIVAVSLLQRYWRQLSGGLKTYLSIGVFVLVCITSAGIYGFLSNAYQKTASKYEISEGQIGLLDNKKSLFQKNIADNQNIIDVKTKRVQQLNELRKNQENRIDLATSNANRNRARNDINSANNEIQKLNNEIDILNNKNVPLLDSVNFYATKIIEIKSTSDASAEIGPLKYLSQLTGQPMDKVVNWFILLLIFVFDPLAVALVIATNKILEIEKNQNNISLESKIPSTEDTKSESTDSNVHQQTEEIKEEPIVEEPVVEEPIVEEPIVEESTIEESIVEEPIVEEPIVEELIVEEPVVEEPIVEEPIVDEVIEGSTEEIIEPLIEIQKREPVIPTGKVELEDIKEIKDSNRGFSLPIPQPSRNTIQRIGSNKFLKNEESKTVYFKRNSR